jgi:hypothetical protein
LHYEILVEDYSGKKMLEILVPKIIAAGDTFAVNSYKGIGRIPKDLGHSPDAAKRHLLTQLPRLLKGFGRTFLGYGASYEATLVVVCDLDTRCFRKFRQELGAVLSACNPKPPTRFCLAIEEGEAWMLGDIEAVLCSYPRAKQTILHNYVNDSICGTWELLAEAVYPGGASELSKKGWSTVGREKSKWAMSIPHFMNVNSNTSPSFNHFCAKLRS